MRRANQRMEWRVLTTLCDTKSATLRGKLIMKLRNDHFGTEATNEVFRKLKYMLDAGKDLPRFRDIPDVVNLTTESETSIRTAITDPDGLRRISANSFDAAMDKLDEAYQVRVYADLHATIGKILSSSSKDDDEPLTSKLESVTESALYKVRRRGMLDDMIHAGVDGDTSMADVVDDVMKGKLAKNRIKTGWEVFDKRSGGLDRGNVLVMTAGTGGGKSVAVNHMLTAMYNQFGYKVANVNLEMSKHEVAERTIANIAGADISKIHLGKLSREDRKKIVNAFDEMDADRNSRYTIFCPSEDSTLQEIIETLAPYGYDVIAIDYLQLLKLVGPKSSNQEQLLSDAVRYAKRIAGKLNCVIILLSQLNEEGQLRGSRAIGFHASYWWRWNCGAEDKQKGFVTVEQPKARSGEQYDFYLTCDFQHMRMDTYVGPESDFESDGESPEPIKDPEKASKQMPRKRITMSLTEDGL